MVPPFPEPTYDVVFKLLFSEDTEGRDALVSLLRAILEPARPVLELELLNPGLPPESPLSHAAILDLLVKLQDGTLVDLEMQRKGPPSFRDRVLFYLAKIHAAQLDRGEAYGELRAGIAILLLNDLDSPALGLHAVFRLVEGKTGELFSDKLEIHLVQLPLVERATLEELEHEPDLVAWARFFRAKSWEEVEELARQNEGIAKARDTMARMQLRMSEAMLARQRELDEHNLETLRQHELKQAELRGKAQGVAEGKAQGVAEGKAEGEVEGKAAALRELIPELCQLLGIELDPARRAQLEASGLAELQALNRALLSQRAWPG